MRKHAGNISLKHASQQKAAAVEIRSRFIENALSSGEFQGVPLNTVQLPFGDSKWVQALAAPAVATDTQDLFLAFAALLRLESVCLQLYSLSGSDINQHGKPSPIEMLKADCSARAGELVTAAMGLGNSGEDTTKMWKVWLSRDPKALLTKLLMK